MRSARTLAESVAFDAPTSVPDAYGGIETGWSEQFVASASFFCRSRSETVQAARLQGRQIVEVTIRAHSAARQITAAWRMRDRRRGTEFNIRGVSETADRAWLIIIAESGVAV